MFGHPVQVDVDGIEVHGRDLIGHEASFEVKENRGLPAPGHAAQQDAVVVDRAQDASD